MKKFFDSFYIFSKYSLNFVLLIFVFFLLYVLYLNYKSEDQLTKTQLEIENDLRVNIIENKNYIKKISDEILENKKALVSIEKMISEKTTKDSKIDLNKINESITILNENFNKLNSEISSLKNNNTNNLENSPELINQSISEVIELIKIKYENSFNFDKELKYLETVLKKENLPILEKISILKENKYKGHVFLEDQFSFETNLYLKNIIEKENNILSNFVLPYINLSPTSENIITDKKVLILKEIKDFIKNREIDKAYDKINRIERYEDFFFTSYTEMKNYNNFIREITKIK